MGCCAGRRALSRTARAEAFTHAALAGVHACRVRRGSAAVLLTIAFAGMLVLTTCLFAGARAALGVSYADAAFQAAGRSVLSEYDTELLSRYGLFAFKGDEKRIEKDIAFYAEASLEKDKTAYLPFASPGKQVRLFDIGIDEIEANLKEFSLMSLDIFEDQLRDAALARTAETLTGSDRSRAEDWSDPRSGHEDRTLGNEGVVESLPSTGMTWSLSDLSGLTGARLADLADRAAADVLGSQYILAAFGHANDGVSEEDSFFDAEVEYILSGRKRDSWNYGSVKTKLTLIRMAANNLAIFTDPRKMLQVEALAAPFAAAAGIGEAVATISIIEIWAGAETKNDIALFEAGRKVAFVKTPAQWALTDAEKAIDGLFEGSVINPPDRTGQSYEDYLRVMLFLMDRETKLLRVMDLIQIDMKAHYDRAFLMREHYTGYRFKAVAGGESFEYVERY